ncbi:MAG: hemagglutinin repeat-containing protein, partial [Sulfurovaceae bacterium]
MTTPHFLPTPSQLISVEERSASNPDNPDYFIQTDPRFTNYQNFLSSDYMLDQLSLDPTTLHKRLGDGYYEQKLVREQIMQLTGKRFLDGFNSDEEQYMALLNSGVEFAKEYGISVGIALSAQQMQNLTKDVVLLVAKDITLSDGTKTTALVPQLYTAAVRTTGTRSLISASNIVTNGDNDLINSGTIMATNVVNLNSTSSINNNTGNISGDYVLLNAGDDININGGNLIASSVMSLNAANDVNIRSTTYTTSNTDGQSDFSRTGIENTANIIVANNDGALWIQSGGDVNLAGVNITNNGDISWIEAGANINLLTLTVSEQNNVVWDSKNHLKEGYIGEIGNTIEAKGDIVLKSGNDIAIKGSDINSLDGHVALKADNNIMIRSASYMTNYDEATYIKRSSLTGTKKTTTVETLDTTNSISSNITGKLVALDSGNDMNIIGSNIISDNGTMLNALNDINILSSTDTIDQTYYNQVKKSGLFSNGGLSVTIGKSQTSTDNKNSSTTLAGSMIGSLNGDTIITAGNEYDQVASDVISGHADEDGNFVASGDVSITAKDINIEAGEKTYSGSAVNKSKQSGLTVALSIPVVNALGDVVTSASDIGESKNARVNAMAVTNTAIDAYQAKNAIGALKGLSDVTSIQDAASATGASLSVTVGSSQSKSTTIYEGTNAVSSTVGGKNVTLKATGDKEKSDINVAGSNISGTSSTTLSADHDINILAAASTDEQHGSNKSSGWNAGAVISAEAVGVTLGGNVG